MNFKFGIAEKYFSDFKSTDEIYMVLVSSQWRKKILNENWIKFIRDESTDRFIDAQKFKVLTFNEYVLINRSDSIRKLISPVQQEFIFQKLLKNNKRVPRAWQNIPSLPVLFRRAYSTREFGNIPMTNDHMEKLYGQIRDKYLQNMHEFSLVDSEQVLIGFVENHKISEQNKLIIEFFPAGTQRINHLYRYFDSLNMLFFIPDIFFKIQPEKDQSFSEWKILLDNWILEQTLTVDQNYYCYANELEEVSAQLDYLDANPETGLIMADPGNYRDVFEQLSINRKRRPSRSRKTLKESPYFELLRLIVNAAIDPDSIDAWKGLFSRRFHLRSLSLLEINIIQKILNNVPIYLSKDSFKALESFMGSGKSDNIKRSLQKNMTEEEIALIPSAWQKMKTFISRVQEVNITDMSSFTKNEWIIKIVDLFDLEKDNVFYFESLHEVIKELLELADFYKSIKIKEITPKEFQRDLHSWFSAKEKDFFPFYRSYELWGLEDAKNIPQDRELWISGLSIDAFPGKFDNNNFLLNSELQSQNDRLRQIEQKAVLMQLLKDHSKNLKVSYSRVVKGQEMAASLVLKDENEVSSVKKFISPFSGSEFIREALPVVKGSDKLLKISATALNTFLKCPHKFYWKYITGINEPEELTVDLKSMEIGTFIHYILQKFFSDEKVVFLFGNIADTDVTYKELSILLSYHIEKAITSSSARKMRADELNARRLDYWINHRIGPNEPGGHLYDFLFEHINYFYALQTNSDGFKGPLEIEPEVFLQVPIEDYIFTGKIDRIDRYNDGETVKIWDYKTGNTNALAAEERKLLNVQREFYAFLFRKKNPDISPVIHTHFQPLKDNRLKPIDDHIEVLHSNIDREFKPGKEDSFQLAKLNYIWNRIVSPEKIIEARLNNADPDPCEQLIPYYQNIHLLDETEMAVLKEKLFDHLKDFNRTSERFLLWLAEKTSEGPYSGIVERHCDFCGYRSICNYYWVNKISGKNTDEE